MPSWKRWVDRAKSYADKVIEVAPAPIAAALERIVPGAVAPPPAPAPAPPPSPTAPPAPAPAAAAPAAPTPAAAAPTAVEDPAVVLARVKAKAERGLKPEDTLVVIYATDRERAGVEQIAKLFDGIDTTVRIMDLDREPQTKRQMARLTDVMVPPYVFINGRYWGGPYEMEALAGTGDLPRVVAHLLDEIGPEARRIGKLRETFSDDITVANLLERWRLGHILCVDDLDAWLETDREGRERFFYQGGERPAEQMEQIAGEVVAAVEAGTYEAHWLLDPAVRMS